MYTVRLEYKGIVKDFGSFTNPIDAIEFSKNSQQIIIIQYLLNRLDYQFGDFYFVESSYFHVYDLKDKRYIDSFDV